MVTMAPFANNGVRFMTVLTPDRRHGSLALLRAAQ